ncbi:MAG: hypothetical protein ACOZF2_09355 [Thermodesulfobacteriota bacterium]
MKNTIMATEKVGIKDITVARRPITPGDPNLVQVMWVPNRVPNRGLAM